MTFFREAASILASSSAVHRHAGEYMLFQTALFLMLPFLRRRRRLYRMVVTLILLEPVVLVAGFNMNGASERVRQKRSMAEVRSLATAVEEYSTDHGRYPVPERPPVPVDTGLRVGPWSRADPIPIAELRSCLERDYIKILPTTDGWGSTIYYDSDGKHYAVIAPAEGGTLESWRWSRGGPGSYWWEDFIFTDGQFFKW